MAFPRRAIAVTAVTGLLLYIFDFPFKAAIGLCLVTFLISGRAYLRLFVNTFPRDLWYVFALALRSSRVYIWFLCFPSVSRMGRNLFYMLLYAWMHKRNNRILSDLFEEQARKYPEKPAIIFANDESTWTFRELNEYANRVANYFSRLGLRKGDTVAIFMENSPEYIGLYIGFWKIGVTAALVNHNLRHESLTHCICAAKSRALVFSSSLASAVSDIHKDLETSIDMAQMSLAVCGDPDGGGRTLDRELQGVSTSPPPVLPNKEMDGRCCYSAVL